MTAPTGWVECPSCGGTGCRNQGESLTHSHGGECDAACADCVGGRVPPEGMVEAIAQAMQYDESPVSGATQAFFDDFKRGLIAAERWRQEHPDG